MTSVNKNPEILTNLGIGSGINTTKLIESLVNAETEGPQAALENKEEEYTPKLFSDDQNHLYDQSVDISKKEQTESDQLFDQDINEEEDFEIPAFLRKQKF